MILDDIDHVSPEDLAAGVYELLCTVSADPDPHTYEKMRDPRLIPILKAIIQTRGRPPFAPQQELPKDRTDRAVMAAAALLGDIGGPGDPETVQALIGLLDDENDRLKLVAARALAELGAAEAEEKILAFTERMMAQGEIGAVSKLTGALAKIGGAETKASLDRFVSQNREAQDKHVQHVVAEAEAAIKSIDEKLA